MATGRRGRPEEFIIALGPAYRVRFGAESLRAFLAYLEQLKGPELKCSESALQVRESMEPKMKYIGIDVSKENLDVCWHNGKESRCENVPHRISKLMIRIQKTKECLTIVCEATGGYERHLVAAAHEAGIPICVVNPARVRSFAKGRGILAKTDRIDASVLQLFGSNNCPRPTRKPTKEEQNLQALVVRRSQLTGMLSDEKKRLANSSELAAQSIKDVITMLKKQIALIEEQLDIAQQTNEQLAQKAELLQSVSGVGPVTTWNLLAFLPELGQVDRRRIASLAGLVPWPRDSGNKQGRRFIFGGRKRVRNVLYMAAVTATRHNAELKAHYQHLLKSGKPEKVAIVAVMRKLLVHLNSIVKNYNLALA